MKKYSIIILTSICILLDQLSKFIIIKYVNNITVIKNFFYLNYVKNSGAAFSIMKGNKIFLLFVSFILIYYLLKELCNNCDKLNIKALTLILGGAIGNLIDRIFRGYVVDFLSFKIFGYYFPIFNLADSFITIGVIILIISMIGSELNDSRKRKRRKKN